MCLNCCETAILCLYGCTFCGLYDIFGLCYFGQVTLLIDTADASGHAAIFT